MAYTRRDIRGGAVQTTISAGIASGATSCAIVASTGWPDGSVNGPFYIVIDPGLSTEEKILCATRSALTLNFTTRGADGSTASAHTSGAICYPILAAVDTDEANYAVAQTVGKVTAASDLLIGAGTNTLARLAKGSNSTVLAVDSGGTLGYTTVTAAMVAADLATQAELDAHAVDTTAIHGIADTSVLATASSVASAVSVHEADTTAVHGIADTAALVLNTRQAIAGAGLTGGGTLAADRTFDVGAGTGITVAADSVAVDSTLVTLGAASTWTPTWFGTSAAIGNATYSARYVRVGRKIVGWLTLKLGTTTVMATNQLAIALPVVAFNPGSFEQVIGTIIFDNNGTRYHGSALIDYVNDAGADRMRLRSWSPNIAATAVVSSAVATSTPFAWSSAATDKFTIEFSYEAAS